MQDPYIYMLAQNNPKVINLTIRDLRKNPGDLKALIKAVKQNTVLTYLSICVDKPTVKECRSIAEMLIENKSLKEFSITKSHMSLEGLKTILDAVQESENITDLDISENKLGIYAGPLIGDMIKKKQNLNSLNMSYNGMDTDGIIDVAAAIVQNPVLKSLDISHTKLKKKGSKLIRILLAQNTALEHLNITRCEIQSRGAIYIAEGLKQNNTLKILEMGENPYTQIEATMILESLHGNITFVHLNISRCWKGFMPGTGGLFLGEAVRNLLLVNNTLKELYIDQTHLYAGAIVEIAKGLMKNNTLTTLSMSRNYPEKLNEKEQTTEGIKALSDVIETCTTLEHLSIDETIISEESVKLLSNAMDKNNTLLKLNFTPDYDADEDLEYNIKEKLRRNKINRKFNTASIYDILLHVLESSK